MDLNKIFTFCYPVLDALNKGSLLKKVFAVFFSVIGVLNLIGGLYLFIKVLDSSPDFWTVILLFLLLCASFISLQIWFYRAKAIQSFGDDEFSAIPIISNLIKALGENYAVVLVALGLGGTLSLWFAKHSSRILGGFSQILPFARDLDETFIGGVLFLIIAFIVALIVLLVTYFIAENIIVLAEIAKNTRKEIPVYDDEDIDEM